MYLLVLLPVVLLIGIVGILSLVYSDPDRVASHLSPYFELEDLNLWG